MNPRYFIGIFPPAGISGELSSTTDALEAHLPEARLGKTPASDIHLTLRFIGELNAEKLSTLTRSLIEVARRHRTFELRPAGIGGFPSTRKARIVWAGVEDGETLARLTHDVEEAVVGVGLEREKRPFRPHFTLARARSPVSLSDLDFEPESFSSFGVESFVLACNPAPGSPRHGEPVYRRVEEFAFTE